MRYMIGLSTTDEEVTINYDCKYIGYINKNLFINNYYIR